MNNTIVENSNVIKNDILDHECQMNIELIAYTPNPELVISNAARICYDSKTKPLDDERKFIRSLIRSGHTSTIEHASATFMISGVSRALTHQLVRHRIASYSQRSQRYVKENNPSFVIPDEVKLNNDALKIYSETIENIYSSYSKLLSLGVKAESARMLLPNACSTKICMTANFREWRNFLKLRLDRHAQKEIRVLASKILEKLMIIAPSCFEDLAVTLSDTESK